MRQQEVIFVLFLASFIFTTKMHAQEARLAFESDLITSDLFLRVILGCITFISITALRIRLSF
jgi:hypothetical protein